ncbi:MAG: peptide chain release factor N(5)-glutamine methyltransferase [Alphaproteobacteria bacterium]|nr:peptide chain release factor N(5)-glutamine methyltransferase [Alphaproteobacteria bacterium]
MPDVSVLTVGQAQRAVAPVLRGAGIDEPVLEARLLLGFVLGGGPERVLADRDEPLSADQARALADAVERRARRVPLSQIVGRREFWSLDFKVTADTLTPRADSETIVETALERAPGTPASVLDLGTGTGCLLLALLSEWKGASGVGVDASEDALAVARDNAAGLGLADRARFIRADWREPGWAARLGGPFDVVVSNPPYIPEADIAGLEPDVRDHEPRLALSGGADGLDAYRVLVRALAGLLRPGGLAVFEVGVAQADDVRALLTAAGMDGVQARADLGGVARAVSALAP